MKRIILSLAGLVFIPVFILMIKGSSLFIQMLFDASQETGNWLGFMFAFVGLMISLIIYVGVSENK